MVSQYDAANSEIGYHYTVSLTVIERMLEATNNSLKASVKYNGLINPVYRINSIVIENIT